MRVLSNEVNNLTTVRLNWICIFVNPEKYAEPAKTSVEELWFAILGAFEIFLEH